MSNSKIIEVLNFLTEKEFDDKKQYEETLSKFQEVDFDDSKYSTIFEFLIDSQAEKRGFGILNENLRNFIQYQEKILNQNEELKKNIVKTYDYLQLEYQRYKQLKNLKDDLNSIQQTAQGEKNNIDDIQNNVTSLQNKIETINAETKQIQTQYITILGVFASIVLAFVGGLTFSTSVLSHMHEVSIYRLIFVICCIGFLLFNILYALFTFLLRVLEKENHMRPIFWVVNGILVAIIIINSLLAHCHLHI